MYTIKPPQITARQKIGLLISLVNTIIVAVVFILFILSYYYLNISQVRQSLDMEVQEIVDKHLEYNGERIVLNSEGQQESIQSDLSTDGASAIIYNADLEPIGQFGVFENNEDTFSNEDTGYDSVLSDVYNESTPSYYSQGDYDDSTSYETLISPIIEDDKIIGVISVAMPVQFYRIIDISISIFMIIIPLSIIINFLLGRLIAKIVFSPLSSLADTINKIDANNTSKHVTLKGHKSDETYILAAKFNEMMERVEEGINKQKGFISNASHELRSPITRAISSLEVLKSKIDKKHKDELGTDIDAIINDLKDMGYLIENMLVLSRLKKGNSRDEVFLVRSLVQEVSNKYKKNKIHNKTEKTLKTNFSQKLLKGIVMNLIENAVKHGAGEDVYISSKKTHESKFSLVITNQVKNSDEIDATKILMKSYKGKNSKDGFGLGLAIIKTIAEENDIDVSISIDKELFSITLDGFPIVDDN